MEPELEMDRVDIYFTDKTEKINYTLKTGGGGQCVYQIFHGSWNWIGHR